MKKILLSFLLSIGLLTAMATSSDPTANEAGVILRVEQYQPYPYALYPNYYHPDQSWHRWHHHGWWGWHHPWRWHRWWY